MMRLERTPFFGLAMAWGGAGVVFFLCLRFGNAQTSLQDLLSGANGLLDGRLIRVVTAACVGAALAGAGLLLQALTRNPLADPGITGVNAGAALGAILSLWVFRDLGGAGVTLTAVAGAALAGGGLWLLVGRDALGTDGALALRLPLAGLAIEALCLTLVSGLLLSDPAMQSRYLQWLSGAMPLSLDPGQGWAFVALLAALAGGAGLCAPLSVLALGADQSLSLGQNPKVTVRLTLAVVMVLAGASVSLAGPIAFIGLLAPFVARAIAPRALVRAYGMALPIGAMVLMLSDLAGRAVWPPYEANAGLIVALVGGPGLILVLARMVRRGDNPEAP